MKPISGGSQTSIQFERDRIAQPPSLLCEGPAVAKSTIGSKPGQNRWLIGVFPIEGGRFITLFRQRITTKAVALGGL